MSKSNENSDGIENPNGLAWAAFGPVFLAAVPVTSYLTQEGGFVQKAVDSLIGAVAYVGSAGATSTVPQGRAIAALGALYVTVVYGFTGAASVAGQAAGRKVGHELNHPRAKTAALKGFPLRLWSSHQNLIEQFGGWAFAAALTAALAPSNRQLVNLLGFHVMTKLFVYYPAYLADIAPARSLGHLLVTASTINVCWRVAQGAL